MANFFPPSATGIDREIELQKSIHGSRLFDYEDLDNNPLAAVRFYDGNGNGLTGYFTYRGVKQNAGQWFEVSAADLNRVHYKAGLVVASEVVQIQVYDGKFWSTPTDSRVYTVEPNLSAPDVETYDVTVVANERIVGSTMFSASDSDGDDVEMFQVRDQKTNSNSGYFILNNVRQDQGAWFEFSADELENLRYQSGKNGQTERFFVRASDGDKWSSASFSIAETLPNVNRPVVSVSDRNLKTNAVTNVSSLFSWSDLDLNTLKSLSFFDTGVLANGGAFWVNGVKQASNSWFTVDAREVENGNVFYHSASLLDSERLRVQVSDGKFKSQVVSFLANTTVTPDIDVVDETQVILDSSVNDLTTWFTQTDPGPTVSTWQFFDASQFLDEFGNELTGTLNFDGNDLPALRIREFTTAELADLSFTAGRADRGIEYDEVFVRGKNDGAGFWSPWQRINLDSLYNMPEALVNPLAKWGPGVLGTGVTMTYSFMEVLPLYYIDLDEDNGTFQPFTPAMRQATREILQTYSQTFNINFVEVSDIVGGDMRFGMIDNTDAIAYAYLPPGFGAPPSNVTVPADIWAELDFVYDEFTDANGNVFPEFGWFDDDAMVKGNDLYSALIHEVGHAMGLQHTFDEGPGSDVLRPQVDNNNFTVMSYTRPDSANAAYPFTDCAASTQVYDNVALNHLYGYNTDYNREDNVYSYLPNEHADYAQTIHDPFGTDTLDFSNYTPSSTIDLREGRHSSVAGASRNFNISYGTVIENAIGGSGNDIIIGNESDNTIQGGRGNDTLRGMGGDDFLFGQQGSDTYGYSLGDARVVVNEERSGGRDVLEISAFHENFDSLTEDLAFRTLENGRSMELSLAPDGNPEGTVKIENQKWGGSRLEILRLFDNEGEQIGQDISLNSIFLQSTDAFQSFAQTEFQDRFGFLAIPS
ncbi:MAG: M10 family metallopeptidase [Pirellulaceae bacterium]|nr:M10 family metallopeptidase [Pirellulaceae bacterium]